MSGKIGLLFVLATLAMAVSGAPALSDESGAKLDDCIHVSIYGDNHIRPGDDIVVPVIISEVTGWGILAFEMEICWCDLPAGLLQYLGCVPGPVMENFGWIPPICNSCGPNCVTIAAADPFPLAGNGPLFYLRFHVSVNAKPCMCCKIRLTDVKLYDPEDPLVVCASDGSVCVDWCDVRGVLKHWYCREDPCEGWQRPIGLEGARVHLWDCHGPVASDYTGPDGGFEFLCLDPLEVNSSGDCFYCVGVDYCEIQRDYINAYDASLILQYLVCSIDLEECAFPLNGGIIKPQQVAADVNCTGLVTAYDAALLLQYVVGIIRTFPCPEMWVFYVMEPGGCTFSCPAFMEFVGVLKGDVSGPQTAAAELLTLPTSVMKLGISLSREGFVDIPVLIEDAAEVYSVEFELTFDKDSYSFVDVRSAGLCADFFMSCREEDGHVYVAMAGASSAEGDGRLAVVRLERNPSVDPGATGRPNLVRALLNEGSPAVEIESRGFQGGVADFRLGPVSPNPFSHTASIGFSAPCETDLSIDIYNVNGRLVRSLFSGPAAAGSHQVSWDGIDSHGASVARGVYFCRMNAQGFSATEKIVVLR